MKPLRVVLLLENKECRRTDSYEVGGVSLNKDYFAIARLCFALIAPNSNRSLDFMISSASLTV